MSRKKNTSNQETSNSTHSSETTNQEEAQEQSVARPEIPQDPDALHAWITKTLGVSVMRTPVVPGHAAPFDYIVHAFFEGAFPKPAPSEPARTPNPDCIVWANRGGGKTYLGALATLLDLVFKEKIQVRILGGSLDQSHRMFDHLRAFLENENLKHLNPTFKARRIKLNNGSAAEVLAASQTSVRGTRVQKLRCDEVDLFDPAVWEAAQLVTRTLRGCDGPWGKDVRGSVEALSTMHVPYGIMWKLAGNPTASPRSPFVSLTISAASEESSPPIPATASRPIFRWGVLDTLEHCTDEYECAKCPLNIECEGRAKALINPAAQGHMTVQDAITLKSRVDRETWEAEMLCLRPKRSETVYPEFDAATHVIEDDGLSAPNSALGTAHSALPRYTRFVAGMDFGFRNETAILLAGVERDGTIVILREHVRRAMLVGEHIRAIRRWLDNGLCRAGADGDGPGLEWIGVDPAGAQKNDQTGVSNIALLREANLKVKFKSSEIADGVRLVRTRIAPAWPGGDVSSSRPQLLVHASCTRLIESLTRYRYDPNHPECLTPLKEGFDHACDALRYLVLNLDAPSRVEVENYLV